MTRDPVADLPALEENIYRVYRIKGGDGFLSHFVIVTWSGALMQQYCFVRALWQNNQGLKKV